MLGEEDIRRERRARVAVVALEDQLTRLARQIVEEQTPERVLFLGERLAHGRSAADERFIFWVQGVLFLLFAA
jgi:hypothetical protein